MDGPSCGPGARAEADLILTNAAVYTENPAEPWAQAIAIADGRILAVGDADTITGGYPATPWTCMARWCCRAFTTPTPTLSPAECRCCNAI